MEPRLPRIYVAGAISSPDAITMLENLRLGQQLSYQLLCLDCAVFSPFIDFLLFFQGNKISNRTIKESSMAWLSVSDAIVVQPIRSQSSMGTQAELRRAADLGIPAFYSLEDFKRWRNNWDCPHSAQS